MKTSTTTSSLMRFALALFGFFVLCIVVLGLDRAIVFFTIFVGMMFQSSSEGTMSYCSRSSSPPEPIRFWKQRCKTVRQHITWWIMNTNAHRQWKQWIYQETRKRFRHVLFLILIIVRRRRNKAQPPQLLHHQQPQRHLTVMDNDDWMVLFVVPDGDVVEDHHKNDDDVDLLTYEDVVEFFTPLLIVMRDGEVRGQQQQQQQQKQPSMNDDLFHLLLPHTMEKEEVRAAVEENSMVETMYDDAKKELSQQHQPFQHVNLTDQQQQQQQLQQEQEQYRRFWIMALDTVSNDKGDKHGLHKQSYQEPVLVGRTAAVHNETNHGPFSSALLSYPKSNFEQHDGDDADPSDKLGIIQTPSPLPEARNPLRTKKKLILRRLRDGRHNHHHPMAAAYTCDQLQAQWQSKRNTIRRQVQVANRKRRLHQKRDLIMMLNNKEKERIDS